MSNILKKILPVLFLLLISVFFYSLTTRGIIGVPSPTQIDTQLNNPGQPFETSQERSRYAILLSMYYNNSVSIDEFASMATPDLGKINGHYYSLFPPTISAMALPLYALGLQIGAPQITVFSISTIASLLTMLFIYIICRKLELSKEVSIFGAIGYGFATNAWGYSVTLYAHTMSGLIIIAGIYLSLFIKNHALLRNTLVWILYGIAIYIDYPNIFIYLPIVLLLSYNGLKIIKSENKFTISYSWNYIFPILAFILMLGAYGYYNHIHFGKATTLSNAIPRVQDLKIVTKSTPEKKKNNGQALNTRNMLEGLKSFTISHDRGLIVYSPFVLLAILGITYVRKKNKLVEFILISVPLTCLTLYTMFGDPYGGWAFGSRYLIAVLPMLCILAAAGLQNYKKNIFIKLLYSLVFMYSCAISLLAPLTTNVIPPFVEARNLGLESYFITNIKMLNNNELNSFVYNTYLSNNFTGTQYYFFIFVLICLLALYLIWLPGKKH